MNCIKIFVEKIDWSDWFIRWEKFLGLGCSSNYSMTSGSLWNYYKDELIDVVNENNENGNYRIK